jgi:transcriptional regulator with GAF, ATPase, and Fis domain
MASSGMSFSDTDTTSTSERDDGHGLHHQVALALVLECQRPSVSGLRVPLDPGARLRIGRGDARVLSSRDTGLELRVPDRKMSAQHAEFERRGDQLLLLDLGSTNGTHVNRRRWSESVALQDGDVVQIGHTFFIVQARPMPPSARRLTAAALEPQGFATLEPGLAAQLEQLARIAQTPLPVLLLGGTGTGKELLARAVHQQSGRKGPFVAVNCGALAPSLIESQLFGHVRGAFSGADREQPGLVRTAHGGTLFLDEIGELRGDAQATLLRVLQEGEVLAVGATEPVRVDLRVVSATLRPVDAQDSDESFRRDLYARLAGFVFSLPPLSQRLEDLGNIIATLLERSAMRKRAISLRPAVAELFLSYGWPLNIRELEQVLAAAGALAEDGIVRVEHLPKALRQLTSDRDSPPAKPSLSNLPESEQLLRAEVISQLRAHAGNVTAAARAMGKARQQVQRWMRRFEIDPTRLDELD